MLVIEPEEEHAPERRADICLLGIEATRRGNWKTLRHVFDMVDTDAGLHVEVGPLGEPEAYAVGYDAFGDELLTPL